MYFLQKNFFQVLLPRWISLVEECCIPMNTVEIQGFDQPSSFVVFFFYKSIPKNFQKCISTK